MNETLPSRSDANDGWLDDVLRADGREHRAGYLDDDGFSARVMSQLPAPAALPAWRKPALAALWAGAGIGIALALPAAFGDFAHEILRIILAQRMSLTGVGASVLVLGASAWAAAAMVLRGE